jgi:hypothetical protein
MRDVPFIRASRTARLSARYSEDPPAGAAFHCVHRLQLHARLHARRGCHVTSYRPGSSVLHAAGALPIDQHNGEG